MYIFVIIIIVRHSKRIVNDLPQFSNVNKLASAMHANWMHNIFVVLNDQKMKSISEFSVSISDVRRA